MTGGDCRGEQGQEERKRPQAGQGGYLEQFLHGKDCPALAQLHRAVLESPIPGRI